MAPRKTSSQYKELVKKRYTEHKADPENQSKLNQLKYAVKKWAETEDVEVLAASNEGEGYQRTSDEIGYSVKPMPLYHAKKWPYYQVGDYQACIPGCGWYGVLIERKTLQDLYGTLMEEDHRRRLWNEHGRFKADPRFKEKGIFRMELECSEDDFFNFFPPYPKNCKFCAKEKANLDTGDVWCYETLTLFPENYDYSDFHCPAGAYEAIRRSPEEIHSLNKKKRTVLRQCLAKGIQLCWRGDREAANEAYKPDLQAWMQDNYVELLKLEEYNDLSYLQEKKSRLEVELQAINGSLQRLGVTV